MFDGLPEQFHQFIASRTPLPTLPHHPLSFPATFHGSSASPITFSSAGFDPYSSQQLPLQPHFLHQLHQVSQIQKHEEKEENSNLVSMNIEMHRAERTVRDVWSNDEILALLKIGSTMENWYPDITWEHVSRKLAEMGFKRSADKCKEKFEEESRYFNNISTYSKNSRLFGALEELCHGENIHQVTPERPRAEVDNMGRQKSIEDTRKELTEGSISSQDNKKIKENANEKKRKREQKFEMFKKICEDVVNRLLAQQEEMHKKLLEDMAKREEEYIAREEARKKEDMDRLNKELEIMAQEQAIAVDRQAKLTEYLNKITASNSEKQCSQEKSNDDQTLPNSPKSPVPTTFQINTSSLGHADSDSSPMTQTLDSENPSLALAPNIPKAPSSLPQEQPPQVPTSQDIQNNPLTPTSSSIPQRSNKDEIGKRWPRDEVLALINLRCNVHNNNDEKELAGKVPIWERISQEMLELGYKRSAKRCKEKWENINKYFRKTKDVNKKRPLDSRTCPYFHQLSNLYNKGKLATSSEGVEICQNLPESLPAEVSHNSSHGVLISESTMHVAKSDKTTVQVAGFDFEY